jgi:hypothetical protein
MAYPVEPFGLRGVQLSLLPPISETGHDGLGKSPHPFGELHGSQANEIQNAHIRFVKLYPPVNRLDAARMAAAERRDPAKRQSVPE